MSTTFADNMKHDITWLVGRQFGQIEKMEWTWSLRLDDGSVIATESTWRLVTDQGVTVTSEDDGQQFGLPAPFDAASAVETELAGQTVSGFALDSTTGDLTIEFGSRRLQFLCLSSGYESWRLTHGAQDLICTGTGKVVKFTPESD